MVLRVQSVYQFQHPLAEWLWECALTSKCQSPFVITLGLYGR